MLAHLKRIVLIVVSICTLCLDIKANSTGAVSKNTFKNHIRSIQFKESSATSNFTTIISDNFLYVSSATIIIFIPTDKVPNTEDYSDQIHNFLHSFSLDNVNRNSLLFFCMTPLQDTKSSTKKSQAEILAQFIEWLPSYYKKSTIILVSDRNGSAIVNYATHSPYLQGHPVDTVVQLYPSITPSVSNQIEQSLNVPHKDSYKELYLIYSDHVNTFTTKKGQKAYDNTIPYRSYLPLKNNEQIAPEEFLTPFCSQRLGKLLSHHPEIYPHHKNFIVYWSAKNPSLDAVYLLKDTELFYDIAHLSKEELIKKGSVISQERFNGENIKITLEKQIGAPLKTSLALSEQSKHFYTSMNNKN